MRKFSLFILFFLISQISFGWGAHFLVTDKALDTPELKGFLDMQTKSEPIELFLFAQKKPLVALFDGYYQWLQTTPSKRFLVGHFSENDPTLLGFLKAARLNPKATFPLLRRRFPSEKPLRNPILLNVISPHEKIDPYFTQEFENAQGRQMTMREILTTFSDEPDWTIDYALWDIPEYGYGTKPYGKTNEPWSGAAFHMQFSHENFIIRTLAPTVQDGMAQDRIELFLRLSRLAFSTQHPYWGARFAAHAIHYMQDLSQPYHAKAVPFANFNYYLKFAFSADKEKYIRDTTQLVSNRHLLFEDFIRGYMEKQDLVQTQESKNLIQALSSGKPMISKISKRETSENLFKEVSERSVEIAWKLDNAVATVYGPRMTGDPTYDFDSDTQYSAGAVYSKSAVELEALVKVAMTPLTTAGEATRTLLEMCRSAP